MSQILMRYVTVPMAEMMNQPAENIAEPARGAEGNDLNHADEQANDQVDGIVPDGRTRLCHEATPLAELSQFHDSSCVGGAINAEDNLHRVASCTPFDERP